MHDQANDLRRLVRQCTVVKTGAVDASVRLIVVAGGKGGVGTTTLAVNLALAFARADRRVVLVDADPHGGDVAVLTGVQERHTLADVLSGSREATETLHQGPEQLKVLPGFWGWESLLGSNGSAGQRLLAQMQALQQQAEMVVLDAGNGPHPILRPCWRAADLRLVVTTPETSAILDTYALIKQWSDRDMPESIHTVVNQAADAALAQDVYGRLAQACRRFLGLELSAAGHVSAEEARQNLSPQIARMAQTILAGLDDPQSNEPSATDPLHRAAEMRA